MYMQHLQYKIIPFSDVKHLFFTLFYDSTYKINDFECFYKQSCIRKFLPYVK
jgi:hypothetical protein